MNRKLFFYFVLVAVLGVAYICFADIRQATSLSNGTAVSTRVGKSQVYTQTSTWIVPPCTCSIQDTTTLLTVNLAPYQNFLMATYLLTSKNQSDKDSLLGGTLDTCRVEYEIAPENKTNDSAWVNLKAMTSYDTLLALRAGLPTLYPTITATAYTPPMGNYLRVRATIAKQRTTATVPDTLTLKWKHIFTPIDR